MMGHAVGRRHLCRINQLEDIILFIQMAKGYIRYGMVELPELLADSGLKLTTVVGGWLEQVGRELERTSNSSFKDVWECELMRLRRESCLLPVDMDNMARLGQILGDMDVDSQVERLDMVRELMDRQRELEREKCAKVVPLAKSMGFFVGVFLVIILV